MTKQEQYNLEFKTIIVEYNGKNITHHLINSLVPNNPLFSILASYYDSDVCEFYIKRIEDAQNGLFYESDIDMDGVGTTVEIIPPNVEYVDGLYQIPMQDFKELLQEWKEFMQQ